jgi:hypothetical protein
VSVEWFVYCHTPFYPWAQIVTAPTVEAAAATVSEREARDGLMVFPLAALAHQDGVPEFEGSLLGALRGRA